jgi:hypothetical protein
MAFENLARVSTGELRSMQVVYRNRPFDRVHAAIWRKFSRGCTTVFAQQSHFDYTAGEDSISILRHNF